MSKELGFDSWQGKQTYRLSKASYLALWPTSFLFSVYWDLFPRGKAAGA